MQVLLLNDNGRQGYIAILDSLAKDGRRNAVKYIGTKFGVGYPLCQSVAGLRIKTVRSASEFGRYIKQANPAIMVNPIMVGPVVVDLPFIHYPGGGVAKWSPYFEKSLSEDSFRAVSGGAIIEYTFNKEIYISVLSAKRHVAACNSERLLINIGNCYTTRQLSVADSDNYSEGSYHVANGVWVCDSIVRTPIAGWKSR